ncbi:MAG TPA: membrane dipeptidase, partial [Aggregatilineales bacterium]|nr:membrane dipeptidase [Aggregatilineales bacterium]
LWVCPPKSALPVPPVMYETPEQAYGLATKQLDYYHRLADEDDRIRLIRVQRDLDEVLESWAEGKEFADHKLGLVVLMEGADPILEPRQAEEWYERDVRIIGPAWDATRYSAGTDAPGSLTSLGWELLDVMSSFNMILDVSHMAEQAFWEAVNNYPGTLFASHSNPRRFRNTPRQLSDDMIRRLAERDSVMGVVPYNVFLQDGWRLGKDRRTDVTLARYLDVIDHVCQVTGSARHVAIGTDWDGGFGWESIPPPFESHIDLFYMRDFLASRNYSEKDITGILSGNLLRILRQGLPV